MTPEGRVKVKIKEWLKTLPHCWFFSPYMAGFGVAGVPDIIGCFYGRFFAIEVKSPGKIKNTTQLQKACIELIKKSGGLVGVVDSLEGAMELLHVLQ